MKHSKIISFAILMLYAVFIVGCTVTESEADPVVVEDSAKSSFSEVVAESDGTISSEPVPVIDDVDEVISSKMPLETFSEPVLPPLPSVVTDEKLLHKPPTNKPVIAEKPEELNLSEIDVSLIKLNQCYLDVDELTLCIGVENSTNSQIQFNSGYTIEKKDGDQWIETAYNSENMGQIINNDVIAKPQGHTPKISRMISLDKLVGTDGLILDGVYRVNLFIGEEKISMEFNTFQNGEVVARDKGVFIVNANTENITKETTELTVIYTNHSEESLEIQHHYEPKFQEKQGDIWFKVEFTKPDYEWVEVETEDGIVREKLYWDYPLNVTMVGSHDVITEVFELKNYKFPLEKGDYRVTFVGDIHWVEFSIE